MNGNIIRKSELSRWEFRQELANSPSQERIDELLIKHSEHVSWLHSAFPDDIWFVTYDDDHYSEQDNIRLDFTTKLGKHGSLNDARHKKTVVAFKLILILTRLDIDDSFYIRKTGTAQRLLNQKLRQILETVLDLGCSSLSEATPFHLKQVLERIILGQLSKGFIDDLSTYVDSCIAQNSVPTYQKSGKTFLDVKAVADAVNASWQVLKNNADAVYHTDRLRKHFNLDLKDRTALKDTIDDVTQLSQSAIRQYASALSDLFYIKKVAPEVDGFSYDPMGDYTVDGFANEFGKAGQRTRNVPVSSAFNLLSDASDQLFEFAKLAIEYQKLLIDSNDWGEAELPMINTGVKEYVDKERNKRIRTEAAKIASQLGIKKHHNANLDAPSMQDVKNVVKHTVSAIVIILLAFTGRRDTEIKRLKMDCLSEAKEGLMSFGETTKSEDLISVYVAKTEKKYDTFPTNNLIIKAVEVMRSIAELSSESTGKTVLFQMYQTGHGHGSCNNFGRLIKAFASLTKNDVDSSGRQIDYACHQFRRFFAILFYWRYGAKDIYSLSSYLGHFSLEMTKVYITEISGESMFNEEEKKWLAKRMASSWFKGEKVGGSVGKSINASGEKIIASLKASIKFLKPDKVDDFYKQKLEEAALEEVDKRGLKVRFTAYAIVCFGGSEGLRSKASCVPPEERSEYQQPRPENASFSMCASCAGGGCFDDTKGLVEAKLLNAKAVAVQSPNSAIGRRAKKDIQAAEVLLGDMKNV